MLEDFRLKVFLTVESEGSFTKAARNLGISQPAVSQNIAELERETGEELFHRNKGSVTLTPAGTTFKRYAERIHHWCSVAEDVFGSAGRLKDASPVTIMADGFASESVLPGVLGSITALNPDLSFKVIPPGSQGEPDLLLTCRPHFAQMSLEDVDTFLYSFGAVALSDVPSLKGSRTIRPGVRMAVWTPYLPLLPLDMAADVVVDSYSVSTLRGLVSSEFVVLVPRDPHAECIPALDIDLSVLRMDLHAVPSPGFAGSETFSVLRNMLLDTE